MYKREKFCAILIAMHLGCKKIKYSRTLNRVSLFTHGCCTKQIANHADNAYHQNMTHWLTEIILDESKVDDFVRYYTDQLQIAKGEVKIKGSIQRMLAELPGITEHRFNQLQEIEAVLEHFNILYRAKKTEHYKKYLERYQRELSSRDAEKYADGDPEVITIAMTQNAVALVRNQFLGVCKALESKNFMLGHITRLKSAGLDDVNIG